MRLFFVVLLIAAGLAGCASKEGATSPKEGSLEGARAAVLDGDLETAEAELLLVLQREPRNARAHADYASLLARTGRPDQAIIGFERSLALDPTNAAALYNLGTLYLRRGDFVGAARGLERALELDPEHVPSYNNLARAYFELGLPELAGAAYEEALALDPENETARANLELLRRASSSQEPAGTEERQDS